MTAALYNFEYDTGADLAVTLTWKDSGGNLVNLTGYTALLTVVTPGDAPNLNYTQASGLTLGGAAGTIAFSIPGSATADWLQGVSYSLFLTSPGGAVTKLMYGDMVQAS